LNVKFLVNKLISLYVGLKCIYRRQIPAYAPDWSMGSLV